MKLFESIFRESLFNKQELLDLAKTSIYGVDNIHEIIAEIKYELYHLGINCPAAIDEDSKHFTVYIPEEASPKEASQMTGIVRDIAQKYEDFYPFLQFKKGSPYKKELKKSEPSEIEDKVDYVRKKAYDFIEEQYPRDKNRAEFLKWAIEIKYKYGYISVLIPPDLYEYTDIWEDIYHVIRVTGREIGIDVELDLVTYGS